LTTTLAKVEWMGKNRVLPTRQAFMAGVWIDKETQVIKDNPNASIAELHDLLATAGFCRTVNAIARKEDDARTGWGSAMAQGSRVNAGME
jgi:hypothetical protein